MPPVVQATYHDDRAVPSDARATSKAAVTTTHHHQEGEDEWEKEDIKQPKNSMGAAIERGGLSAWLSLLTFGWAGPFLRLGSSRTLTEEDLDGIYKYHRSEYLYENLRRNWERERTTVAGDISHNRSRRKGTALLMAIWTTFRTRTLVSAAVLIADSVVHISQAIAVGWFIRYFDDENSSSLDGWLAALSIVVLASLYSVLHHHLFFLTWVFGMLLRISTTTILYDKILRLRLSSLGQVLTS